MKIKRFVGADMRSTIALVRNDQGPDAVILSSRAVEGGIEIVAAVDYDQDLVSQLALQEAGGSKRRQEVAAEAQPTAAPAAVGAKAATISNEAAAAKAAAPRVAAAPEAARAKPAAARIQWSQDPALQAMRAELAVMKGLLQEQFAHLAWADLNSFQPQRAALLRRILDLGLDASLAATISAEVANIQEPAKAWREVIFALGRRLNVVSEDPVDEGGIFALVGPTGVGKTTTIAKLAARHCLRYGAESLLLISTDGFRVGAQRQLEAFATILGVGVRQADSAAELDRLLATHQHKRLILIDTAGMAPRDQKLAANMQLLHTRQPIKTVLVLAANMQAMVMHQAVTAFGSNRLAGISITKIDEADGLGAALSVLIARRLPAIWLSDGQRVPEDLKTARTVHLISWAAKPRSQTTDVRGDLEVPPLWVAQHIQHNKPSVREIAGVSA